MCQVFFCLKMAAFAYLCYNNTQHIKKTKQAIDDCPFKLMILTKVNKIAVSFLFKTWCFLRV